MKRMIICLAIVFFSCNQGASFKKIEEINSACDLLEELEKVHDALTNFKNTDSLVYAHISRSQPAIDGSTKEGAKLLLDISEFERKYAERIKAYNVMRERMTDLRQVAQKRYTPKEFQECADFERIKNKLF